MKIRSRTKQKLHNMFEYVIEPFFVIYIRLQEIVQNSYFLIVFYHFLTVQSSSRNFNNDM